jgi:hypothetical protein
MRLRQEVVRDPVQVRLKLKDRKVRLRKETGLAVVYGQRELRQQDHQTTAAETGRVSNRYDWNDPGTKIVNHRYWRRLKAVKGALKRSRGYVLPPRSRQNRS